MSPGFRQLLLILLRGGCAPTVCSLTLQQDSGEPWQKHREFTSQLLSNYLWVISVGNLLLLLIFLWSRIRQCIPRFKKWCGGQTCSDGGWVYNGEGEELLWSSKFSWQQLQSRGWPFIKTSQVQVKQAAGPRDCRPPVLIDLALLNFLT